MRKISIIINNALAKREILCTPLFDILRNNPENEITIFTQPRDFIKTHHVKGVKIHSYQYLLWLRKIGVKRFSIVFWAYRIFGIAKSDIIIVASWIDMELIRVIKLAQRLGTPVLFLQEGIGNPWESYPVDIYPDKLLVWSDIAKAAYIKRGIEPERIVVTGQPRLDWYAKPHENDGFSKAKGKKALLYATQPLWKEPKRFIDGAGIVEKTFDIVYRVSRKLDLQLVCKLHPSDKPDFYKREGVMILEETGTDPKNYKKWYCNTGFDPGVDDMKRLRDIILSSDLVVTMFSTVGLEAMIAGKPVIFLDIANYAKKEPVSRSLAENASFAFASSEEQFEGLVVKYINNPGVDKDKRDSAVYSLAYKQDGIASQRIADIVGESLKY